LNGIKSRFQFEPDEEDFAIAFKITSLFDPLGSTIVVKSIRPPGLAIFPETDFLWWIIISFYPEFTIALEFQFKIILAPLGS
jgi:hypothetical protein